MTAPPPTVRSVNVGRPREVTWLNRSMRTSIGKQSVEGPVEVLDDGLVGDEQSDPDHHGGADKAVYAYAAEDYAWWAASSVARCRLRRSGRTSRSPGST